LAKKDFLRRKEERKSSFLTENSLGLTAGAEVASEALAKASAVVADTTSRAIAALAVTVAEKDIRASRAFLERAVRAAVTEITDAANVLERVPWGAVGLACLVGELFLGVADAASVAVVGADGTFAGNAVVVVEALAFTSLAIADSLVGAFDRRVGLVGRGGDGNPGVRLGACSVTAISTSPSDFAVRAVVARALVVGAAGAVAGAAVRAVRVGGADEGKEEESGLHCL
jgi:hypothetical protein